MNWLNFRNKVKEDLYSYKSEEDALDIWNNIQGQVGELNERKKKKDYRFLFVILFLIGSSASILFFADSFRLKKNVNEKSMVIKSPDGDLKVIKEAKILDNDVEHNLDIDLPQKDFVTTVQYKKANKVKNTELDTQTKSSHLKKQPLANSSTKAEEKSVVQHDVDSYMPRIIAPTTKTIVNSISRERKSESYSLSESKLIINEVSIKERNSLKDVPKIELLGIEKIKLSTFEPLPSFSIKESVDEDIVTPKVNKFSVGFNAGLFYTIKSIEASIPENLGFRDARRKSERILETIHKGIYGEYALNSKFSFSIGIDYTRINEEFRFVEIDDEVDFVEGIKFVFNGQGVNHLSNSALTGLVKETTTTTTDYTLYNSYELIDIPLLITYKYSKNKWSYGVRAGLIANLSFNGTGRILASEFKSEDLANQNVLKNSIGLSYSLGLVLEHRINNSFSFVAVPSLRYFPNEVSAENYSLTQEFQFIGGDIGLKYSF